MSFLFWILLALIGSIAIWWLIDWHDQHEDGE